MNGWTVSEMSEKLNVPVNTLRQRISRLGIKPLTQEAVYDFDVLNKLRDVKRGAPKKTPEPVKASPKSSKKSKK